MKGKSMIGEIKQKFKVTNTNTPMPIQKLLPLQLKVEAYSETEANAITSIETEKKEGRPFFA